MNVHSPGQPIGIFDSGLGGLSVAAELRRELPGERLIYAADSRYCPYGTRSTAEILWRSVEMSRALVDRGVKLLIVACNTASAVALEELRAQFEIPIIGLEPAVKPAIDMTRSGKIAVLATPQTAASARLRRLVERHAAAVDVRIVPAPDLVELVEAGETDSPAALAAITPLVKSMLRDGVDTIVLGCTHYPFLRDVMASVAGEGVTLVDSGAAIARRARTLLEGAGSQACDEAAAGLQLLTTGDTNQVTKVASRLLGFAVAAGPLATAENRAEAWSGYSPPAALASL